MKPAEKKRITGRSILVAIVFSIFFAAIGAKAVYLQVFQCSWLSQKAAEQYEKQLTFYGNRGIIYDANHMEMACSINVTSIAVSPQKIKNKAAASKWLAKTLKLKKKNLERKLRSKKPFVWIKRHITPKETKAVRNFGLDGVIFVPERCRFYPNRTLAAQVLGFSGIDGNGLEGIEFSYNSYLKGRAKNITVLKDALGRRFDSEEKRGEDFSGKNVILTIDRTIQYITEKALEDAGKEFSAKSGIAIVMDPKTGAVLSLANYPFFNPNSFQKFDQKTWRNRAISDSFEPGSTMKIFLAAAALETGKIAPSTIFYCENGSYKIGRNIVHDAHPYGWLSLQQIVKYSSNIGATKITEIMGKKTLYETLKRFGFGTKSGFDCPGETAGSLSSYRRWTKIDSSAISFGQGISVSAIQLTTAASAIANQGILMRPYIVRGIMDNDGNMIKRFRPCKVRRVVSTRTANTVKRIMKTVITEGGTGINAAVDGYTVCGKTGTAQKTDNKGKYAKGKYLASFIGFAPAENPEIVIFVLIDEPKNMHYGGTVAAPVFGKIASETLNYLNLPLHRQEYCNIKDDSNGGRQFKTKTENVKRG